MTKITKKVTAIILTVLMVGSVLPLSAFALDSNAITATVNDPSTSAIENRFSNSTADDGKLEADKTVVYGQDEYGAFTQVGQDEATVALSALGQGYAVTEKVTTTTETVMHPDVLFIVDVSGSMYRYSTAADSNGQTKTRIEATVDALNTAIDELVANDPDTRWGVVCYGNNVYSNGIYLPIDKYTIDNTGLSDTDREEYGGWFTANYTVKSGSTKTIPTELAGTLLMSTGVNGATTYLYPATGIVSTENDESALRFAITNAGEVTAYNGANTVGTFSIPHDGDVYYVAIGGVNYAILHSGNIYKLYKDVTPISGTRTVETVSYQLNSTTANQPSTSISTNANSKTTLFTVDGITYSAYRNTNNLYVYRNNSLVCTVYRGNTGTYADSHFNLTFSFNFTRSGINNNYTYTAKWNYPVLKTSTTTENITTAQASATKVVTATLTKTDVRNSGSATGYPYAIATSGLIKNSSGNTLSPTYYAYGNDGTYTASGLYAAESMFSALSDRANRIPVIVLITDGNPTFAATNYANPSAAPASNTGTAETANTTSTSIANSGTNKILGNGQTSQASNRLAGFTIMTASVVKKYVSNLYTDADAFYMTIGPGITSDFSKLFLEPSDENVETALTLTSETQPDDSSIATAKGLANWLKTNISDSSTYSTLVDIDNLSDFSVSGNYSTEQYLDAMHQLVAKIADNTRPIRTIATSTVNNSTGFIADKNDYVEFTDTLGAGMKVTGDPVLIYQDTAYTFTSKEAENKATSYNGNPITYTRYVYDKKVTETSTKKEIELEGVIVEVYTDAEGNSFVKWLIPSDVLPVITPVYEKGKEVSYNSADPIRLIFKVGLDEAKASTALNIETEGTVEASFYTNSTEKPTTVKFCPTSSNPYYFDLQANSNGTMSYVAAYDGTSTDKTNNTTGTLPTSNTTEMDSNGFATITLGNNGKITVKAYRIVATKVWDDNNYSGRPTSVKLQLYKNGTAFGDPLTVTGSGNSWTGGWTIPGERNPSDVFTVQEVGTDARYEATASGLTVTNTSSTLTVTKSWNDVNYNGRPESIQLQLFDGINAVGDPVTVTGTGNRWSYTFRVPGKLADHNYNVKEVNTDERYNVSYSANGLTITNTYDTSKLPEITKTADSQSQLESTGTAWVSLTAKDNVRTGTSGTVVDTMGANYDLQMAALAGGKVNLAEHGITPAITVSYIPAAVTPGSLTSLNNVSAASASYVVTGKDNRVQVPGSTTTYTYDPVTVYVQKNITNGTAVSNVYLGLDNCIWYFDTSVTSTSLNALKSKTVTTETGTLYSDANGSSSQSYTYIENPNQSNGLVSFTASTSANFNIKSGNYYFRILGGGSSGNLTADSLFSNTNGYNHNWRLVEANNKSYLYNTYNSKTYYIKNATNTSTNQSDRVPVYIYEKATLYKKVPHTSSTNTIVGTDDRINYGLSGVTAYSLACGAGIDTSYLESNTKISSYPGTDQSSITTQTLADAIENLGASYDTGAVDSFVTGTYQVPVYVGDTLIGNVSVTVSNSTATISADNAVYSDFGGTTPAVYSTEKTIYVRENISTTSSGVYLLGNTDAIICYDTSGSGNPITYSVSPVASGTFVDSSEKSVTYTNYIEDANIGDAHKFTVSNSNSKLTFVSVAEPSCALRADTSATKGLRIASGANQRDFSVITNSNGSAKLYRKEATKYYTITYVSNAFSQSNTNPANESNAASLYLYKPVTVKALTTAATDTRISYALVGTTAYTFGTGDTTVNAKLFANTQVSYYEKGNTSAKQTLSLSDSRVQTSGEIDVNRPGEYTMTVTVDGHEIGTISVTIVAPSAGGDYATIETVTFNADGTEAYSNLKDGNILSNGKINASEFTYDLATEVFTWNIPEFKGTEYKLTYLVYLTGSEEGLRNAGRYDTNESAYLYYRDTAGGVYTMTYPVPNLEWKESKVYTVIYIVDMEGNPITVDSEGNEKAVDDISDAALDERNSVELNINQSTTIDKDSIVDIIPEGYVVFDPTASVDVTISNVPSADGSYLADVNIEDETDTTADGTVTVDPENNTITNNKVSGSGSGSGSNMGSAGIITPTNTNDFSQVYFAVVKLSFPAATLVADYGLDISLNTKADNKLLNSTTSYHYIGVAEPGAAYTTDYMKTRPAMTEEFANESSTLNLQGDFGHLSVSANGDARYTIETMNFTSDDTFYLVCEVTEINGRTLDAPLYGYERLSFVPATTIYYEDDFSAITYTDGTSATGMGKWTLLTDGVASEFQDADIAGSEFAHNYGFDSHYTEFTTYSNANAKYVEVGERNLAKNGGTYPSFSFQFTGTGFDVVALSNNLAGYYVVEVKNAKTNKAVAKKVVDTYYGYKYGRLYVTEGGEATLTDTGRPLYETGVSSYDIEKGNYHSTAIIENLTINEKLCINDIYYSLIPTYKTADGGYTLDPTEGGEFAYASDWLIDDSVDFALYQVPVMTVLDLPYDCYNVTVTARYTSSGKHYSVDEGGYKYFKLYVDAIRVYDPAGTSDSYDNGMSTVVSQAYAADGEQYPFYMEIKDMLIGADSFGTTDETETIEKTTINGTLVSNFNTNAGTVWVYTSDITASMTEDIERNRVAFGSNGSCAYFEADSETATRSFTIADGETFSYAPWNIAIVRHGSAYFLYRVEDNFFDADGNATYTTETVETSAEGVIFLDGNDAIKADMLTAYAKKGPNNELYLAKGQAVAFEIAADAIPQDVQIGLKHATGTIPTTVEFIYNARTYTVSISTSTDMYYSLVDMFGSNLTWSTLADGNITSGTIIIRNNSASDDAILSVTNVKWTFGKDAAGNYVSRKGEIVSSNVMALNTCAMLCAVDSDLTIDAEAVETEVGYKENGDKTVTLTFTTSSDVEELVVRDENGKAVNSDRLTAIANRYDDGTTQWQVTLTESGEGEFTYTLQAVNSGFATQDPIEIKVTLAAPVEETTEETTVAPEETTAEPTTSAPETTTAEETTVAPAEETTSAPVAEETEVTEVAPSSQEENAALARLKGIFESIKSFFAKLLALLGINR